MDSKDFDKNSDIDLVAISRNGLDIKYEQEMISKLKRCKKLDIRIRILYLSELNGGSPKGTLAKVLPVRLWLIDFEKYLNLAGEKFTENDFKIKKANYGEAAEIEAKIFRREYERLKVESSGRMYAIKSAIYYFYYKSCEKNEVFDFSYKDLVGEVENKHKEIVSALVEIKNGGYKIKEIERILPKLDDLICNKS